MKLTGKKFLIILLYARGESGQFNEKIIGRTRLMKMGFIFKQEKLKLFEKDMYSEENAFPEFTAWKYGPFSKDLLTDLEFLINQKYIDVDISSLAPIKEELEEYQFWVDDLDDFRIREYDQEVFTLSEIKGIPKAIEYWNILTDNQKDIITDFKKRLNQIPLNKILEYVYKKYSAAGYTDKSLIKDKFFY